MEKYRWNGKQSKGYDRVEENFCDYFGRRMSLPNKMLLEYETIDEETMINIMSRFRADLDDTVTALMEVGLLPPRIAMDSYNPVYPNEDYSEKVTRSVFCLHCMKVGGDYACPNVDMPTPLFDLTDRAWGGRMQSCLGEDLHKPDIMASLTKYYIENEVQPVLFRPE